MSLAEEVKTMHKWNSDDPEKTYRWAYRAGYWANDPSVDHTSPLQSADYLAQSKLRWVWDMGLKDGIGDRECDEG